MRAGNYAWESVILLRKLLLSAIMVLLVHMGPQLQARARPQNFPVVLTRPPRRGMPGRGRGGVPGHRGQPGHARSGGHDLTCCCKRSSQDMPAT
jgi:hypothetical protein